MTPGVSSLLSLRLAAASAAASAAAAVARRPAAVAPAFGSRVSSRNAVQALVPTAIRAVSVPAAPMFSKAKENYEARNKASAAAPRPSPPSNLKKALFPPSSPRDGSIAEYCKRPLSGTAQASTFRRQPSLGGAPKSRPAAATIPLQPRSPNTPHLASGIGRAAASSLATLCGKSDSFTEEPPMAAVSTATSGRSQTGHSDLEAFGFSPDDITDDENLDLDFQAPCALPPVPALTAGRPHTHPPTALPQVKADASRSSVKRAPDDAGLSSSPVPVAKKRSIPKHWSRPMHGEQPAVSATPMAKPAQNALWDASASAVKAQRKQLKDLSKKQMPADEDDGGSRADTDEATSQVAKAAPWEAPKPVVLSDEQQHVKNLVCLKRASVFFTGPAGTGKSVLMRAIIDDMRRKYAKDPEQLGVTASTGLAACNIGGMTLHSFSGIGLGKEDVPALVRKIRQNPKARNRWLNTKTLVIDEVSMVDGDLFDKLSQIGRTIRKNGRPWGGIQLVLTGDFFQLPPVPDREKREVKFAFEAETWKMSIDHTIGLTEVFRQKDPEFAQMLNEMRLGRITDETVRTFKSLSRNLQFDDGLQATELFPTRQEVESANEKRLRALKGKSHLYEALDTGDPAMRDRLLQNMMAPKSLELRVGAQVMLIKNMDETLVNGSLGTIERFMTESEHTMLDGEAMHIDLKIKKRISVINSYLNVDDTSAGGGGGGSSANNRLYPYVLFHGVGGVTRGILIRPEEWKSELPNGVVQASRTQLPLILAWALSIHKAQGQTLDRVKVDLGRVFEKGQAYVALSRATTKHGLQVLRFEKHKVMAHPKVVTFYNQLSSAESALKGKGGDTSILAFTAKSTVKVEERPSFAEKTARFAFGAR